MRSYLNTEDIHVLIPLLHLLLVMEYMEEDKPLKSGSIVGMELQHHCNTSLVQDVLIFSLLKK